ncbi:MAG: hypothetical protein JHD40_09435 [Acidimicrobiia bacterium]|nr:hypothetical protein [Acidimicrobiia bacterium]
MELRAMPHNPDTVISNQFASLAISQMVFSSGVLEFIYRLGRPGGDRTLSQICVDTSEESAEQVRTSEFNVESRKARDNDQLLVIRLGEVTGSQKQSFVGIRFDHKTVALGSIPPARSTGLPRDQFSDIARVIHLEETSNHQTIIREIDKQGGLLFLSRGHSFSAGAMFEILEGLGPVTTWRRPVTPAVKEVRRWDSGGKASATSMGTSIGETNVDTGSQNAGQAVQIIQSEFAQVPSWPVQEPQGEEPYVQRRANWIRRFIARQLRRLAGWLERRRERREAR